MLTQILSYSDIYGGDIKDALSNMIADVMSDRMEDEKNKSETAATLTIVLLINIGVAVTAAFNLISNPLISEVFTHTLMGKFLLAVAALFCFISLRKTRNIVEE